MNQVMTPEKAAALAQLVREKKEYERRREGGRGRGLRGLVGTIRPDPFPGVSSLEAAELFEVSCRGALGGGRRFDAGAAGPATYLTEVKAGFDPDGRGPGMHLHFLDRSGTEERRVSSDWIPFRVSGGKGLREAGALPLWDCPDEEARKGAGMFVDRVSSFRDDLSSAMGRTYSPREVRGAVGEARRCREEERAAEAECEGVRRWCRNAFRVDSLEGYIRVRLEVRDIAEACRRDPSLNDANARARYESLEEMGRAYRERPDGLAAALRGGMRSDLPAGRLLEESEKKVVLGMKDVRLDADGKPVLGKAGRERVLEEFVSTARRAGWEKEEIREGLSALSAADGPYRGAGLPAGMEMEAVCRRADASRIDVLDRLLLSTRCKDAPEFLEKEARSLKVTGEELERTDVLFRSRLLCGRLGIGRDDDPEEVAKRLLDCREPHDPSLVLGDLSDGREPNRFEVAYDTELSRRFSEKVWIASMDDGGVPHLAGEHESKGVSRSSASEVFGRELMVNAALLAERSPAESGRYLREAGVRPDSSGDMRKAVMQAAAKLYGDGSVEAAGRVQVFRERFAGSVREARVAHYRNLVPRQGASQALKAKPAGLNLNKH